MTMVLFIKVMMAIVIGFILLLLIDLINGLRGEPSDYAGNVAFVGEGIQFLSAFALGIIVLVMILFFCVMFIFG